MKLEVLRLTLLNCLFAATAYAHPGPPGHAHSDDWPFEAFAIIVGIITMGVVFSKLFRGVK